MKSKKDEGQKDPQQERIELKNALGDSFQVKKNAKGEIFIKAILTKKRIETVSKPFAPTTIMCDKPEQDAALHQDVLQAITRLKDIDKRVWAIAVIQKVSGARISEVLTLDYRNIMENGNIALRGAKRSNDRIVSSGEAWNYLKWCKDLKINPFEELNRFYVYRLYKSVGIILNTGKSEKFAITHAFRHIYVQQAEKIVSTENIQKQIGHKSINSTKHYEKESSKKTKL
jgi:integrase